VPKLTALRPIHPPSWQSLASLGGFMETNSAHFEFDV
jgi:hypothetical protein